MKLTRLKEIREELELTQQNVADVLNVKRGTYASWEAGTDVIPLKQLYNFAKHYKKSTDYILKLTNIDTQTTIKNDISATIIGRNIEFIRKKTGLSQLNFAKSININQSTLWAYEKGKTLITTLNLLSICKVYNITLDSLLNISDEKVPIPTY